MVKVTDRYFTARSRRHVGINHIFDVKEMSKKALFDSIYEDTVVTTLIQHPTSDEVSTQQYVVNAHKI